jgi:LysM repeat protein
LNVKLDVAMLLQNLLKRDANDVFQKKRIINVINIKRNKMSRILLLIGLFITFFSNSQSINQLEYKNGYKSLKLNSHKSNLIHNLSFIENKGGYSTYKYVEAYEVTYEYITLRKKVGLYVLANQYLTSANNLMSLNPNMKFKRGFVKKKQKIKVPIKKKSSKYPIDKTLFNLFDYPVSSINLIFENSSNRLKKISLFINEKLSVNYLSTLGFRLKKLYNKFAEIVGTTTDDFKPTSDCYKFPNQTCLYFEDRIFDGTIIWESTSVVLKIHHNAEIGFNRDLTSYLKVDKLVSFEDKSYYKSIKNSGF